MSERGELAGGRGEECKGVRVYKGVSSSPRLFAAGTAKRSSDTQGPEKSNSNLSFLSAFFVDDFFFSEAFATPFLWLFPPSSFSSSSSSLWFSSAIDAARGMVVTMAAAARRVPLGESEETNKQANKQ